MSFMIERPRILQLIRDRRGAGLIEAGAGTGKTEVLRQLAAGDGALLVTGPRSGDADGHLYRAIGLAMDGANIEREGHLTSADQVVEILDRSNTLLAFDQIEIWHPTDAEELMTLTQLSPKRVILAGRDLGGIDLGIAGQSPPLDVQHLAFTLDEVSALLTERGIDSSQDLAVVVFDLTQGWPIAVGQAVGHLALASDPHKEARGLAQRDALAVDLAVTSLADLDDAERAAADTIALFPFLDEAVCDMVGPPNVLATLRRAGVGFARHASGWLQLQPIYRRALERTAQSTARKPPTEAIDYLVQQGFSVEVIQVLVRAGDRTAAAALLGSLDTEQRAQLHPDQTRTVVAELGNAVDGAPRSLFVHAQICAVHGQHEEGFAALTRAVQAFEAQDPGCFDSAHIEALIHLGLWQTFSGDLDAAQAIEERCTTQMSENLVNHNLAHLFELRGLIAQTRGELADARDSLSQALDIWRQLNAPLEAAVTLFRLVGAVLLSQGEFRAALAMLDDLPSYGAMSLQNQAKLKLERALILPFVGRAGEVRGEASEAQRLGELLELDGLVAWSLVAEATAAGVLEDAETVSRIHYRLEAEGHLDDPTLNDAYRWGEMAEANCRVGNFELAHQARERLEAVPAVPTWYRLFVASMIEARLGDPEKGRMLLAQLDECTGMDAGLTEVAELNRSLCCLRTGDLSGSRVALDRALTSRRTVAAVDGRVVAEIQTAVAGLATAKRVRLAVFDVFRVRASMQVIDPPQGASTKLVKLLALNDGRLTIDQAVDGLWPDSDLETGRRRLRNVLTRVRAGYGPIVDREGESLLLVDEEVDCDLIDAQRVARQALAPGASVVVLRRAIQLCDRPILPQDRYEDWAEEARTSHYRLLGTLFDQLATREIEAGNVADARLALQRSIDVDPTMTRERTKRLEQLD